MIGYTTLGTNDMTRAAAFYDPLLAELGAKRLMDMAPHMIAWGTSFAQPMVAVIEPYDGQPATVGNGVMVALLVTEPVQVDKLHVKALELGAKDEGAPGPRGDGFYGGYFRDMDGNKLNFFCITARAPAEK